MKKEYDSIYEVGNYKKIITQIPSGFTLTSIQNNFDLYNYGKLMWKGFNLELNGEGEYTPSQKDLERLKTALMNASGDFVSYCWYEQDMKIALIEPVATIPEYRKLGFGKIVVFEAIKRVAQLGAKDIQVGSGQQFYYNIGFSPLTISTLWTLK